jgi:Protein of unknown function (DUF3551)
MLRVALFTSAVMTALLTLPTVASAQYGPAPWCAVLNTGMGNVYWDCQYATAAECAPHVISGNRGFCNPNPAYAGRRDNAQDCRIVRHHVWRDGRRVVVRERLCR